MTTYQSMQLTIILGLHLPIVKQYEPKVGQGKENIGNRWVLIERVHTAENILKAHIYLKGCLIKYDIDY